MVLAGLEAAWRAWRRSPPSSVAGRIENVLLLVLLVTTAGGLGLFVGGARPRELLHFVYAIIALAAVPVADSLARRVGPRQRGFATIAGSLVGFVVILRLFGTG